MNTTVELLVSKTSRLFISVWTYSGYRLHQCTALYLSGERRIGLIALVISCLIAVSRLYLYVHYPTDVLGGIIFGCLSGWLGYHIVKFAEREKDSKIIMHKIRVSICFYGRVQGVGFRYKLRYLAEKYSVTGWARNEYDGSVSTELQGLEEDIDKILQALYNDRYIEIDDIRKRSLPVDEEERGFGVRY